MRVTCSNSNTNNKDYPYIIKRGLNTAAVCLYVYSNKTLKDS